MRAAAATAETTAVVNKQGVELPALPQRLPVHGAAAIGELWSRPDAAHPLAHHATDIVVSEDPDGTVRVLSKGLGIGTSGRVGSVVYRDVVERTARGWRFAARKGQLRR